jgi:hypothetical protein
VTSILHITNGDSAVRPIEESGIGGEVIAWRDVLHDGPVPADLSLAELSRVRAEYLADVEPGDTEALAGEFAARDAALARATDHDIVALWFEWDLYDQLQLIQILDQLATIDDDELRETGTSIEMVSIAGYLGATAYDRFPVLWQGREPVTREMLDLGSEAWQAVRSPEPTHVADLVERGTEPLPFLSGALERFLEELPSVDNGLARSERQLLDALAQGPKSFSEAFQIAARREERIYCGDLSAARYLERVGSGDEPLVLFPSGERVHAPRRDADSAAFRNAELALTHAGRSVLTRERDWIEMGGADRWLGGIHLDGRNAEWRWDRDRRSLVHAA